MANSTLVLLIRQIPTDSSQLSRESKLEMMVADSQMDEGPVCHSEKLELPQHGQAEWVGRRVKLVQQAINDNDVGALREISALPGGFGTDEMRRLAWPVLLRLDDMYPDAEGSSSHTTDQALQDGPAGTPHVDEAQVLLDTKRSFVAYPKGLPPGSKLEMQADLHSLIVRVLRLYPSLSYFQGFHDIMSVFYLTFIPLPPLPPSPRSRSRSRREARDRSRSNSVNGKTLSAFSSGTSTPADELVHTASDTPNEGPRLDRLPREPAAPDRNSPEWALLHRCAEVVSVDRVRDAMGKGMEPMMGLLKLLKRLLHAADPELARFSSTISPIPTLPFFALSWILCLFSHDVDTLEPVQRLFDFLLARNPVSAVYLAVAILVIKKPQMMRLARELESEALEDPSLLHPLFARLPPLFSDTPDNPLPSSKTEAEKDDNDFNPYEPIPLSRIFALTDQLLAKYPWVGPVMRGNEVMGESSSILTYGTSSDRRELEKKAHGELVKPGAMEPDEEDEEPVQVTRRKGIHLPTNKTGTIIAIGVLAVGIILASRSVKSHRGLWSIGRTLREWMVSNDQGLLGEVMRRYESLALFLRRAI